MLPPRERSPPRLSPRARARRTQSARDCWFKQDPAQSGPTGRCGRGTDADKAAGRSILCTVRRRRPRRLRVNADRAGPLRGLPGLWPGCERQEPQPSVPPDDRPGFESIDRAYETPYAIAAALSRLPLKSPEALRGRAPHRHCCWPTWRAISTARCCTTEAHQLIVAYLLERAGLRAAAAGSP